MEPHTLCYHLLSETFTWKLMIYVYNVFISTNTFQVDITKIRYGSVADSDAIFLHAWKALMAFAYPLKSVEDRSKLRTGDLRVPTIFNKITVTKNKRKAPVDPEWDESD